MPSETDIVYENGRFWILREKFKGRTIYRVLENVGTHSVRRDTFDLMLGRDRDGGAHNAVIKGEDFTVDIALRRKLDDMGR